MGRPKKLSEEQVAEVFAAWNNGKPVKTIAMNQSVSLGTIYKVLTGTPKPNWKQLELDLGDKNGS